jgi:hypothetical protein
LLVALTKTTSQILVVPIYNFSQRTFLMKFWKWPMHFIFHNGCGTFGLIMVLSQ